jgi:predicted DNA-binding transcriptional regulator YafY
VTYRRWEAPREVERTLAPYGLVLKNGTWYAVAATRGRDGTRTYRVSNILALQPTEEAFERPGDFDLTDHWSRHLAAFDARRITGTATVRVAPTLSRRLSDFGDTELRRAAAAGSVDGDGWTRAVLNIESVDHAARQLIGHGTEIEVLDPPALRAALASRARDLARLYG